MTNVEFPNDEGMTKHKDRIIRASSFEHSFDIRISSFDIMHGDVQPLLFARQLDRHLSAKHPLRVAALSQRLG